MNISRKIKKFLSITWVMKNDEYSTQFGELESSLKNSELELKLIKYDSINKREIIYDEGIIIMNGSAFRKYVDFIEENCFLYRVYIFDKMSNLFQNLVVDFPYIGTVTNNLKDIITEINKDASELSKLFLIKIQMVL